MTFVIQSIIVGVVVAFFAKYLERMKDYQRMKNFAVFLLLEVSGHREMLKHLAELTADKAAVHVERAVPFDTAVWEQYREHFAVLPLQDVKAISEYYESIRTINKELAASYAEQKDVAKAVNGYDLVMRILSPLVRTLPCNQ